MKRMNKIGLEIRSDDGEIVTSSRYNAFSGQRFTDPERMRIPLGVDYPGATILTNSRRVARDGSGAKLEAAKQTARDFIAADAGELPPQRKKRRPQVKPSPTSAPANAEEVPQDAGNEGDDK